MAKEKIILNDPKTNKELILQTTTDTLNKNVTITIPNKSTILVTKEDMDKQITTALTMLSNINKPVIISPTNNEIDYTGGIQISPYITSEFFIGEHTNTVIQIATDINFNNIVINEVLGNVEYYVTSNLMGNTVYFVRVKYVSNDISSNWSDVVKFTPKKFLISRPIINVSGDVNNVNDNFLIQLSYFNSIDNNVTHISTDWEVIDKVTNEVVWSSINNTENLLSINVETDVLSTNTNYFIKARFNGSNDSASDTGSLLIKTKDVFTTIGVDNNQYVTGFTNDVEYFGEVGIDQLDGTYNYTGPYGLNRPTKVYAKDEQVLYNDVLYRALKASTNVTPGTDATVWEIDTRENLPTGKWILDQVGIGYGLNDGNADGRSTGSATIGVLKNNDQGWMKYIHSGKLIYIAKKPWVDTIAWTDIAKREAESGKRTVRIGKHLYYIRLIKEDEYVNCLLNSTNGVLDTQECSITEKTWIHDVQEGANRKVMSDSNVVSTLPTISRTGSYRPVLEYIPEGEEPYNNIKTGIPLATAENFQYDFYTDTGYFGHVPSTSLIGGNSLATTVGLTAGRAQNDATGYFKFYWHGILLYVTKQTIRHTVSWDNINTANVIYGKDMGGTGLKTVTVGSNTYAVQLLLGADKSPSTGYTGHNSQWNELIYRVNTYIPKLGDNSIATEGMQIGANWANYGNAEMSLVSGNGRASWCQEIYSLNTSYRIIRGYNRLATVTAYPAAVASSNFGVRLVLRVL